MVYAIGVRENAVLDSRKPQDMCDMIHGLHDRKEAMEKLKERKLTPKELTNLAACARPTTRVHVGLWNHYWHFAKYEGEIWELFSKILIGTTAHPKFTAPKALTYFQMTRSLPTEIVATYYKKVVDGHMSLLEMDSHFKLQKAMNKVRLVIADFLKGNGYNVAVHFQGKSLNWGTLQNDIRYPPCLVDENLVYTFGKIGARLKSPKITDPIPGLYDKLRERLIEFHSSVQSFY